MLQSLGFIAKKWEYNDKIQLKNPKTDCELATHALRNNVQKEAAGLCFLWALRIVSDGGVAIDYSSQECFVIPNQNISDKELLNIVSDSYRNAYKDVATRNLKVGLNATFPDFDEIPIDLQDIKSVLYT